MPVKLLLPTVCWPIDPYGTEDDEHGPPPPPPLLAAAAQHCWDCCGCCEVVAPPPPLWPPFKFDDWEPFKALANECTLNILCPGLKSSVGEIHTHLSDNLPNLCDFMSALISSKKQMKSLKVCSH